MARVPLETRPKQERESPVIYILSVMNTCNMNVLTTIRELGGFSITAGYSVKIIIF
jgi:hypothetical protein